MPNHRLSVLLSNWFSSFTSTSHFLHYFLNEKMNYDAYQFYFKTPVAFDEALDISLTS